MATLPVIVGLIFALLFYAVYGADAAYLRVRRSYDPCQQQQLNVSPHFGPPPPPYGPPPPPYGPPPPPFGPPPPPYIPYPPPPLLRTQNWSGYHRTADGSQQGVFSGAAAETGAASGQAYSLAASGGSDYSKGYGGQSFGDSRRSGQLSSQHSEKAKDGYSGYQGYQSQNKGAITVGSQGQQSDTGHYVQPLQSTYSSSSAQAQSSSNSGTYGSSGKGLNQVENYGKQVSGSGTHEDLGYLDNHQTISDSQHSNSYADKQRQEPKELDVDESTQSVKGALELASQGLQTQANLGCSTCQKGSLAISNAKTNRGSAVAVSIGG